MRLRNIGQNRAVMWPNQNGITPRPIISAEIVLIEIVLAEIVSSGVREAGGCIRLPIEKSRRSTDATDTFH